MKAALARHHEILKVAIESRHVGQNATVILECLSLAVNPAPTAHDAFDMLSRSGAPYGEQSLFDLWRSDSSECANLRV